MSRADVLALEYTSSIDTLLWGALAMAFAMFLAGVVGFAYALISVPLLLLAGMPVADVVTLNLTIGLATRTFVMWRLRRHVCWSRWGMLVAGSAPGIVSGAALRGTLSPRVVEIFAGVLILAASVWLSFHRSRRPREPGGALVVGTGAAGGFLGSMTSLNGFPPAVLLRAAAVPTRTFHADLAGFFVAANAATLAVLAATGESSFSSVALPLALWLPVGVVGNAVGLSLAPRLPQVVFHHLVLGVLFASSCVIIVRAAV